ncbi:hypothetical protein B0H67DRAFT_557589 [Lasiosphaeris hirsuta]|uniref:DUF6536 domain-containing protein n=1 Tax=Lasiosphaeris hirsuta TaxID=260670 RepID=A0AA40DL74_9PEZI|nr:hypothetical protein B0H67DRAFT_557589 [Lasiosphaeris hirsuta]
MQILNAPTRREVDCVHIKSGGTKWLEIGVPSIRSAFHVSRFKTILWVLFNLSSVPIHLLFNSAILETDFMGTEFHLTIATESFLNGTKYYGPGASFLPPGGVSIPELLKTDENASDMMGFIIEGGFPPKTYRDPTTGKPSLWAAVADSPDAGIAATSTVDLGYSTFAVFVVLVAAVLLVVVPRIITQPPPEGANGPIRWHREKKAYGIDPGSLGSGEDQGLIRGGSSEGDDGGRMDPLDPLDGLEARLELSQGKLRWGVVRMAEEWYGRFGGDFHDEGVGHLALGSEEQWVHEPRPGWYYA